MTEPPGDGPATATGGLPEGPFDPHTPPRRPPGRTGIGPAAIVAIIAVVLVGGFVLLALLSGGPEAGTTRGRVVPGPVRGTGLAAVGGAHLLAPIVGGGEPPADVVAAVAVPAGATRVSSSSPGAGVDQYDERVTLSVRATEGAVYAFYRAEMAAAGWKISDAGPAPDHRQLEVLGRRAASDGWYWEMGAVVSPTTFAAGPGGPGTGAGTTKVTIRLYQVSDEQ